MTLSLLILTGQSGSGKSTALRALEDRGYLCVDNLPTALLEPMILMMRQEHPTQKIALVMDLRERRLPELAPALVQRLRQSSDMLRVIYFEAQEDILVRRYSETRRRHPLDDGGGLRQAIIRERQLLAPLRELADEMLDTSTMSPHVLRAQVMQRIAGVEPGDDLRMAFLSFGFKYGLPIEADIVLDVRFMQNPFFIPELKEKTGLEQAVRDYVLNADGAREFVDHTTKLLNFLVPRYQQEGKRYLTIAIGCTGGKHRSVAIAQALFEQIRNLGHQVDVNHRDIERRT